MQSSATIGLLMSLPVGLLLVSHTYLCQRFTLNADSRFSTHLGLHRWLRCHMGPCLMDPDFRDLPPFHSRQGGVYRCIEQLGKQLRHRLLRPSHVRGKTSQYIHAEVYETELTYDLFRPGPGVHTSSSPSFWPVLSCGSISIFRRQRVRHSKRWTVCLTATLVRGMRSFSEKLSRKSVCLPSRALQWYGWRRERRVTLSRWLDCH